MYSRYDESTDGDLSDQIIVPAYFMQRWFDSPLNNSSSRLLIRLINTDNNKEHIVSIGAPHNDDKCIIYAPSWIISSIGCDELTPVRVVRLTEDLPSIRRITIKPLDNIIFNTDIMACFTEAFDRLHVVHEGMTLPMRIGELGGYDMLAYIDKVEPAPICLTCKGEIEVDFIRDDLEEDFCKPVLHAPDSISESAGCVESDKVTADTEVKESSGTILSLEERRRRIRESWALKSLNGLP